MKIYGKDYQFRLTIGASAELSKLCPDGDIAKIQSMLAKDYGTNIAFTAKMAAIMSKGYEMAMRFEAGEHVNEKEITSLTEEMGVALPPKEYYQLQNEVYASFAKDVNTTVETEPEKKNKKSEKITLNLAWFLFYGRKLNMGKQEILCTTYGEMCDMISCFSIFNGAKPKKKKRMYSFDEVLALR